MSRPKKNEENPPADRRTTPRVRLSEKKNVAEQTLCHIYNEVQNWEADEIRKNVCVNDEPLTEFEGGHYCLFHLPTKDKDIAKFEEIFAERLKKVDEQCAAIEAEFPDDEEKQDEAKRQKGIIYDFRYVWFPAEVNFNSATFSSDVFFYYAIFSSYANFHLATFSSDTYFNSATFSSSADFRLATFSSSADFNSATFSSVANFSSATFSSDADFNSAMFSSNAHFGSATFSSDAYFLLATFSSVANFSSAKFSSEAYFGSATFDEKSEIFFAETTFEKKLSLQYAIIKGYVAFVGKQSNRMFVKDTSLLDLQNARIDEAKEISFHTVRLEASWFINTEARELVFTDCQWAYADGQRLAVKRELENLKKRELENPHAVLAKACWQLADNHEESKSFAKSSVFRQIAHESRRLKTAWYFQPLTIHWWYYAVSFYGERWTRAFFILLGILFLSGVFYNSPWAYFEMPEKKKETVGSVTNELKPKEYYKMNNFEGFIHSLYVAALQRPEPKPASDSDLTKAVVILETIFAPLQAALLALAIRRKFMR